MWVILPVGGSCSSLNLVMRSAFAVGLACLSACTAPADSGSGAVSSAGAAPTNAIVWELQRLNGQAFAASADLTIRPDGTGVSGRGPCNSYSAQGTIDCSIIALVAIRATRRACQDLGSEQSFFVALWRVSQLAIAGTEMVLSGPGDIRLDFTARPTGAQKR